MNNAEIITVSQLNFYVKSLLDENQILSQVFLSGEISNLTNHYRSGHIYLSLKDDKASIKSVMFAGNASRLKFKPTDGMKVIARGRVSLYEAYGQYQFYIDEMQPDGAGALAVAYEQLKAKLEAEGLFNAEFKKPLPDMPARIGVITSSTGAARRDIENVLKRRFPIAEILLFPATVQGDNAPKELIEAVNYFNKNNCADVIILGRGGGSIEDLWAFNDENLARTVFKSKIPIISAVGHETDYTICDFVSDKRAPTPSAAAEIAVPDISTILEKIENLRYTLTYFCKKQIEEQKGKLNLLAGSKALSSSSEYFNNFFIQLDDLTNSLNASANNIISAKTNKLDALSLQLNALSPLNVMLRGYSIALNKKKVISSVKNINVNDEIEVKVSDGLLNCKVLDVRSDTNG